MWYKKTSFLIFLIVFLACSWFFSTGGWNQISRIDAIMSFVEFPVEKRANPDFLTFRINHFISAPEKGYNTGDWSFYNGNYYSNKAPGALFLGIFTYAPLHFLEYLIFGFLDDILTDVINMYIVNLVQSVLPAALSAWILFYILQMLGTGKNASAFWSLAYGLGTPVFCYSSMMWGHVLAAACFMFAIYFYLKKSNKNMIFCGLFCGYAVLSDYLCGVLVPVFAVMIFLRSYLENEGGTKERCMKCIKSLSYFALGGIPMFLLYAMYHKICFGSFFTPATVFNNPVFHDKEMIGGTFGSFRPFIILKLLFSQHRGLLYYSPVLLFAIPGFVKMIRDKREKKILAWGLFLIIAGTLFAVASFNGWHGGHSFSARYLIPVIPAFAVLCGAFPLDSLVRKISAAGAFLLSFFYMLIVTYLNPLINEFVQEPFWGLAVDCLKSSHKTLPPPQLIRLYGMIENMKEEAASYSSFSLGELIGLSGYGSMILLTGLLSIFIFYIFTGNSTLRQTAEKVKQNITEVFSREYNYTLPGLLLLSSAALTFLFPGNEVWINDEPRFILKALQANDDLQFASSAFPGSFGIAYGPGAVWFFQLLLLVTFKPFWIIFLKTLISLLLILWSFRKIFNLLDCKCNWLLSATVFLVSPYVLHFNRKIWDCGVLYILEICMFAFIAEYILKRNTGSLIASSLCALLMLLTHPLALPVAVLLPVIVFISGFIKEENIIIANRKKTRKITILHTLCSAVIAGVPSLLYYFYTVKKIPSAGGGKTVSSNPIFKRFFEYCGNLSGYRVIDEFILDLLPPDTLLYQYIHYVSIFAAFLILCGLVLGIWCFAKSIRYKGITKENILILFAIMCIITKFVFDMIFNLALYPHYHMLAVMPCLILFITGVSNLPEWRKYILYGVIISVFTISLIFVSIVEISYGSRSCAYGPTLGNQFEMVRNVEKMIRLGVINKFRHDIGNYKTFPKALESLFFLNAHIYKPLEKNLPPAGVKYNMILHYVSPDPASGLLGLNIQQVAGPQHDITENLEK